MELRCLNVEASAELYGRITGLEPAGRGADQAQLRAPGATEPVLVLRRAETPGPGPRRAAGLFHTAFRYPTRAGLALALERVEKAGARLTGVADHGVSEALYLDDPDGIGIELYRDRPRERWPAPAAGERIAMYSEPLDLADLAAAGGPGTAADSAGPDIGHAHLKVADTAAAERFWTEQAGMELMTRFGPQASFLACDGYHHHIGANSWHSLGADLEPAVGPGLDAVAVTSSGAAGSLRTPDGVRVELLAERAT